MIVLFDLNGTLTDSRAIGEPWDAPTLGLDVLDSAAQTAMVDALTGHYRPFSEHVRAAIELHARRRGLDAGRIDQAAQRAASLPAFPDAPGALDALRGAGARLAVLTNSGAQSGERALRCAGLAERFERVLGVDAVASYKPDPRTYAYAAEALGASRPEVTLVAAHAWDVTGAGRAGLRTCWISGGADPSPVAHEPDLCARNLDEAARALIG